MTETQKLYKELEEMKNTMNTSKKDNTVKCNAPSLKKTYTYKKQTVITANDVRL